MIAARPEELRGERGPLLAQMLFDQSGRLCHLLDQLLDLSRLDDSGVRIEPQAFAVRARVERILQLVAGERAAEVELEIGERARG